MFRRSDLRLEAEDMKLLRNLREVNGAKFSSEDGFIFAKNKKVGTALAKFEGESGLYDVRVRYFDENDGESLVKLKIGDDVAAFRMDGDDGANRPSRKSAEADTVFHAIEIDAGDVVKLQTKRHKGELGAIDYIEFIPVDEKGRSSEPPQPETAIAPDDDAVAFIDQVVFLTNKIRARHGLGELKVDDSLSRAAAEHSSDMAENDYFSHVSRDGDRLRQRTADEGYGSRYVGENIAAGHDTAEEVVAGWMRSAGHRANILNAKFNEIGVGYAYEDDSRFDEYWVQVFGYDPA